MGSRPSRNSSLSERLRRANEVIASLMRNPARQYACVSAPSRRNVPSFGELDAPTPGCQRALDLDGGKAVRSRLAAGAKGIRTHGPTMNGADRGGCLAPTIALAREGSLSFRHLSSATRGTMSSNPLCSADNYVDDTAIPPGLSKRGLNKVRPVIIGKAQHAGGNFGCDRGLIRCRC